MPGTLLAAKWVCRPPRAANESERRMNNSGKAPTLIAWIICLILNAVALTAHLRGL